MPADELTKQHFLALKTMVETFSDAQPEGTFEYTTQENAYEALNVMLKQHPEWRDPPTDTERLDFWEQYRICPDFNNIPDRPGALREAIDEWISVQLSSNILSQLDKQRIRGETFSDTILKPGWLR